VPPPQPRTEPARSRPRHYALLASFLLLVALPLIATIGYLWGRAAPEYHSETAFSIRSEEVGSAAAGLLGAITQIGSGSASDTDILYDFIRSQEIVERIGAKLDLRAIFNRAEGDPVFTLGEDTSTEALLEHWRRMVQVDLESSEGIITVKAFAFTPEDARAITREVLAESDALVNALSEQAREDAVRFARAELAEVEDRLRAVRQDMADFRREHRMIDPSGDVAGRSGLLNALEAELAQALVERDMLLSYAQAGDQRVAQADRRIDAITRRIEAERESVLSGAATGSLPELVGAYEELKVDLEFASTAYTQGLAGLAAARAEASRQSRYLVPHVQPTLADTALYPRRVLIAGMAGLFLLLGWSVLMLVYYNVRDNR
jgi:capsular polysaccharide transport system permease protein